MNAPRQSGIESLKIDPTLRNIFGSFPDLAHYTNSQMGLAYTIL